MRAPPRARMALAALLASGAALMAWYAVYQVDDAYIVYRYAENLANGHGFAFNPGQRVEGVTCFLWTLLLVPFAALGLPLPVVAPLLGAACGLLTCALLPAMSARMDGREGWDVGDLAAPALVLATPAFAYWSVGGLETVPATLLLVLGLARHLRDGRLGLASAVPLAMAPLVRPEAPLPIAAVLADRLLASRGRLREHAAWIAIVAAPGLALLVFRRAYFGAWLPNTYWAKTGGGPAGQARAGIGYVGDFLSSFVEPLGGSHALAFSPWSAPLGGVLVAAALAWGLLHPQRRVLALVVLALLLAVVLEGGDWMPLHRFLVPAVPLLWLLASSAGRRLARRGAAAAVLAIAAGALLGAIGLAYGHSMRVAPGGLLSNAEGYRHAHVHVADLLRARARPGDTVALMDVGLIGWRTGLRVFDISGLVEPEVAHSPGGFLSKRYPVEALLVRQPRFVVLVPGFPTDDRIAAHPVFQRRYRLVTRRNHRFNWDPPGSYVLSVYERRG